jgi:tetratricopeptide (TPR) repeat protein
MMRVRIVTMALLALVAARAGGAVEPDPDALRRAGHWKQIRSMFEPKYRSNPGDLRSLYWMARVKVAFGDPQAGYELARTLVGANPNNADYQFALAEAVGSLARRAGLIKALSYRGEFKRSIEGALALNPRHAEALNMHALYYLNAPFIAGGDKNRGMLLVRTLAKIDPAMACLAEVTQAMNDKDRDRAEALLKKASADDPRSYIIQARLAAFYFNTEPRRVDEAIRYATSALAIDPGRVSAYNTLARAYAGAENWSQLDAVLAQAERGVPDNLAPYFNAARILLTTGKDLPRAERYLRKYLAVEPEAEAPDSATARWRLGQVVERLGRPREAVAEFEAALRLRPDLAEAEKDLRRLK